MTGSLSSREQRWREVPAPVVRSSIASALLERAPERVTLGGIELAPHQREAVARLTPIIARSGGALLADAVGLGKTYVALAIARQAERPLVVAPAALRAMWAGAMARAGVIAAFVSTEQLSRGSAAVAGPDLVVVDEAHHFRNPATRRYASLARLAERARVLLLSATPVHNTERELTALLALFLGSGAHGLPAAELARCIVRRERAAAGAWDGRAARVGAPRWITLRPEDDLLEALEALPPPVPPRDGDDGGTLLLFSLLRQWASSHGALAAALRRRIARATALIAALEEGRHPTRTELAAWRFADSAVQLAFPSLVATSIAPDVGEMLERARVHEQAVRALLRRVDGARGDGRLRRGADAERARHLLDVRASHPDEKIVAFSQFADTVNALYGELRATPGVAALAGREARVAGGTLSRAEVLRRFAPRAGGHSPPRRSEQVDLLLTTDLLSEGVNLQDASIVVHLDLPWTPARLEQRVGRAARPDAARDRVVVYAFEPPATAEKVLAVERRLRAKLAAAARTIGASGIILPSLVSPPRTAADAPAVLTESVRDVLTRWLRDAEPTCALEQVRDAATAVAVVRCGRVAALALVAGGKRVRLLAITPRGVTEAPDVIHELVGVASGAAAPANPAIVARALRVVDDWLTLHDDESEAELRLVRQQGARRQVLRRVMSAVARAPAHARARLAPLALAARRAATLPLGAGAERVLRELAAAELADEPWLRAVAEFAELQGREAGCGEARAAHVVALLLLER